MRERERGGDGLDVGEGGEDEGDEGELLRGACRGRCAGTERGLLITPSAKHKTTPNPTLTSHHHLRCCHRNCIVLFIYCPLENTHISAYFITFSASFDLPSKLAAHPDQTRYEPEAMQSMSNCLPSLHFPSTCQLHGHSLSFSLLSRPKSAKRKVVEPDIWNIGCRSLGSHRYIVHLSARLQTTRRVRQRHSFKISIPLFPASPPHVHCGVIRRAAGSFALLLLRYKQT